MSTPAEIPVGMAGLRYPITQVSLVVEDVDALLDLYYRTFGWAPWQDFDHVPPMHRNTMYKGRDVEYSLRGAEVYVGSLNYELLWPLPGGESLFHDHLTNRGESIASIASMFHEKADGDAVKVAFRDEFGLDVFNKANIGDHIEYYYVDTQEQFGCPIESGSGHAIDFVGPARVYPSEDAEFGPSPESGITYTIYQITLVVEDLDTKVANYHRAFGWGPWSVFNTRQTGLLSETRFRGADASFEALFAQTMVGDINFEIVEPRGGDSPWQEFAEHHGEGLLGIAVAPAEPADLDDVSDQMARSGVEELASARVGDARWKLFDTQDGFKTLIASSDRHALDEVEPERRYPS